jgi:hypothetical protein
VEEEIFLFRIKLESAEKINMVEEKGLKATDFKLWDRTLCFWRSKPRRFG